MPSGAAFDQDIGEPTLLRKRLELRCQFARPVGGAKIECAGGPTRVLRVSGRCRLAFRKIAVELTLFFRRTVSTGDVDARPSDRRRPNKPNCRLRTKGIASPPVGYPNF